MEWFSFTWELDIASVSQIPTVVLTWTILLLWCKRSSWSSILSRNELSEEHGEKKPTTSFSWHQCGHRWFWYFIRNFTLWSLPLLCFSARQRITSMNSEVFSSALSYHSSYVSCIRHSKLSKSEVPQEILRIITVTGENEQFHYSFIWVRNCVLLKYYHKAD